MRPRVVVGRPFNPETDLMEALVAIEAQGIHIVLLEEPHDAGQRLLAALGVTWTVDPDAPRLADPLPPEAYDRGGPIRPLKRELGLGS